MKTMLECLRCGQTGPVFQPGDWCLCGSESRWELLDRGCPDNPQPERHGYVRVHLGLFNPVA